MISFFIIALIVLGGAVSAVSLRNLIHCALALTAALAGTGVLFLTLGAQFAGFAQVLVYVGAVAILIVFAILLTRGSEPAGERMLAPGWFWGVAVAVVTSALICGVVLESRLPHTTNPLKPSASVAQLGSELMSRYVLPLEAVGLLLTAALIGAVVIAVRGKEDR